MVNEPASTAVVLFIAAVLLGLSALLSRTSVRVGLPFPLLFLAIGMIAAGSDGIGRIRFEDYELAFRLGTVALVLILFDGGLNTPLRAIRAVALPAGVLATVGVVGVAALAAVGEGSTVLLPGDHVHVFADTSEKGLVQLIFGAEESA